MSIQREPKEYRLLVLLGYIASTLIFHDFLTVRRSKSHVEQIHYYL